MVMPLSRAFETYSILTIGDALVSQIPAVIISVASALLLARGGAVGSTDLELFCAAWPLSGCFGDGFGADGADWPRSRNADRARLPWRRLRLVSWHGVRRSPPRTNPHLDARADAGAATCANQSAMCWISTTSISNLPRTSWPWCWTRRPGWKVENREHAEPRRRQLRADPAGNSPDRRGGVAARHLSHSAAGRRKGA